MPLFRFHIGQETVQIGPEDIAEQFLRHPSSFGHRFSEEECQALADPIFLEGLKKAAATVNDSAAIVASACRGVFAEVEAFPWR